MNRILHTVYRAGLSQLDLLVRLIYPARITALCASASIEAAHCLLWGLWLAVGLSLDAFRLLLSRRYYHLWYVEAACSTQTEPFFRY